MPKYFDVASRGVGLPDYSAPKPTGQVPIGPIYTSTDIAELAARLGSIVTFDRRGSVILLDDYESPIQRFKDFVDAGCVVRFSSARAKSGSQSLELRTEGAGTRAASIIHFPAPILTGRHGIKISFSLYPSPPVDSDYTIGCTFFDGTTAKYGRIKFNFKAKTIAYKGSDGSYTVFERNFNIYTSIADFFHDCKLVVDLDTGYFVRLLLDHLSWDLSSYPYYEVGDPTQPTIHATLKFENRSGSAYSLFQDDFVYTINEP